MFKVSVKFPPDNAKKKKKLKAPSFTVTTNTRQQRDKHTV